MNKLYLITGPAGVGKTTISNALAKRLDKSVLIEGDDIYHMVISSYVPAWKHGNHLDLFWKNVVSLIRNSLEKCYDVVFNYIIKKDDYLILKKEFNKYDVIFKVLMVDEEELLGRDKLREKENRMNERCLILLKKFIEENFDEEFIIDSTNLNIENTVERVIK